MKTDRRYIWLLSLLVGVQALQAAPSIRPGVWEYTTTIKSQSGEMEKAMAQMEQQMAALPPEQRKMMEQSMAAQGVVKSSNKPHTLKVCISPEKARQSFIPATDGQCEQKLIRSSANTLWFKYTCKGNPPSSGEGEYTFSADTAYTGKMTMRTTVQGKPEVMQMNHTGKWISGDCSKLKMR